MFGDSTLQIIIKAVDQATGVFRSVEASAKRITPTFAETTAASQKFALGLTAVAAAAGGLAYQGISTAAQLETMRQGFVTLLGSAQKADETMNRIKIEAARTPFELAGLTSATQALSLVTKDGNKSIDVLLNVGKALAAAGKGQPELDRIIANLQQIALTGKITAMDIRQFGMNGINILELLGDYYGTTTAKAADMVQQSSNAFADLSGAFAKAGGAGGKFFTAYTDQAGTFAQVLSNAKDSLNIFLSELVKQTGIFDLAKRAVTKFTDVLNALIPKIAGVVTWLGQHKEVVAAIAGAIIGALIPAAIGAGMAFIYMMAPLLPFMAAGALIAGILAVTGGLQGLLDTIDKHTGLITLFKWAWDQISTSFTETLMPALQQLWDALKPLQPELMLIAKVVGGVLLAAVYGIVLAITGWIEIINGVIALGARFEAVMINNFVTPITKLIDEVKSAIQWVGNLASRISGITGGSILSSVTKSVGNLLHFEQGGTIPGPIGMPVPIIAHGQETILPAGAGRSNGGTYQVVINNPQVRSLSDVDYMRQQIEAALRDVVRVHKLATI